MCLWLGLLVLATDPNRERELAAQEAAAAAVYDGQKHLRPFGVDVRQIWGGFEKWAGAASVGKQVVFAPAASDFILVLTVKQGHHLDMDTGKPKLLYTVSKISTHNVMDSVWGEGIKTSPMGPYKWCGVVAKDGHAYFVPYLADCVMDLDLAKWNAEREEDGLADRGTAALSKIDIPKHLAKAGSHLAVGFGTEKWLGASIARGDLFLAPSYVGDIPVVHLANGTVSSRDAKPLTGNQGPMQLPLGGHFEWRGSASVGDKVYYAPYDADSILVVDASACNETQQELAMRAMKVGTPTFCGMKKIRTDKVEVGRRKWFGAVAVGTKVVFAPDDAESVLILDTVTELLSKVNISAVDEGSSKWRGGVAVGSKVFFAPYNSQKLLIVDAAAGLVDAAPDVSAVAKGGRKWMGGALVDMGSYGIVAFTPYSANQILLFDTTGYALTWTEASNIKPPPPSSLREGEEESFLQKSQGQVSVNFRGEVHPV